MKAETRTTVLDKPAPTSRLPRCTWEGYQVRCRREAVVVIEECDHHGSHEWAYCERHAAERGES
jgi:hypothetical protein